MGGGADAGGTHGQLARMRAAPGNQVAQRAQRAVCGHHDAEGVARDHQHRLDVAQRLPGGLLLMREAIHRQRQLADGVAVRPRRGKQATHQRAAGARPVLHHDRLPQLTPGQLRQDAHGDIGGAARWPWHHQRDRPRRIPVRALGQRGARMDQAEARQHQAGKAATEAAEHGWAPGRVLMRVNRARPIPCAAQHGAALHARRCLAAPDALPDAAARPCLVRCAAHDCPMVEHRPAACARGCPVL